MSGQRSRLVDFIHLSFQEYFAALNDSTGVCDLSPLAGLIELDWLSLAGCTGLTDLSPLAGLTDLRTLKLDGCSSLPREEIEKLYRARPMLAR